MKIFNAVHGAICAAGSLVFFFSPLGGSTMAADVPQANRVEDRRVAALDTLVVDVLGEEDLSGERRVQASGNMLFPLLGTVHVSGKTAAEVSELLRAKLEKDYLVDPFVSVVVKDYASRTVNVTGEVKKPGKYEIPGEKTWTIVDAITAAEGFTPEAKEGKIELFRDGKRRVFSWDDVRGTNDPDRVFWLKEGDLVNVPRSFF